MTQIVNEEAKKTLQSDEKRKVFNNAETGLRSKTLEYLNSGKSQTARGGLVGIFKKYVSLRRGLNGDLETASKPVMGFNEHGTLTELQTYDKNKREVVYAMVLENRKDEWLGISMTSTPNSEVVNISEDVGRIVSIMNSVKEGKEPLKALKHDAPQFGGIAIVEEDKEENSSIYNWKEILRS